MSKVYLSLGSNMGNRKAYLEEAVLAISQLKDTKLVAVSSVYETAAWGNTNQADFLNLCCLLETSLLPNILLEKTQAIENQLGRMRHVHWGPRTIDIDLLLYDDQTVNSKLLIIPHPYMCERAFVLKPLLDLEATLSLPNGDKLADYLDRLDTTDIHYHSDLSLPSSALKQ
ncbi:2-amino-4-hydroxy-6-hydroxymethyldihydropteridine diphosphokinase [Streptococcus sciuri]|uniref:2-amino-4-hydroxy-6-hydroxymethyldihydropteridine diphosphokinase n=1 Tax=Streptococcus sciuri TaxID=2973939 RepID=A0ABT2F6I3_9STRE|nr:2-amino-4-hydroxy-6-hydroxymethyldihydropteridine diphosphokinase [Streptococcus sciuri]MCS4487422.1 2-amino-4-hydroxy-6-hydroxymethyldihydropteridine diphosphokinase [Streptococcus sciuri]